MTSWCHATASTVWSGIWGPCRYPTGCAPDWRRRLDALDPDLRSLVAEAAVLGSTFSAESLVAVSALDEESVRRGLAELLRREVLSITADRLSPQRGDYRFAQDLLRQVAYDTMSRSLTARPDISSWPLTCGR